MYKLAAIILNKYAKSKNTLQILYNPWNQYSLNSRVSLVYKEVF